MGQLVSTVACSLLGAVYPGYMSYKSIKNHDQHELMRWIQYWIVYSFFFGFEFFFDLFLSWLPFYYYLKVIFLAYLIFGSGAESVFKNVIRPQLDQHEEKIDQNLDQMWEEAIRRGSSFKDQAVDKVVKIVKDGTQEAVQKGIVESILGNVAGGGNNNKIDDNNKNSSGADSGAGHVTLASLVDHVTVNPPKWLIPLKRPVGTGSGATTGVTAFYHGEISKNLAEGRLKKAGVDEGVYLVWKSADTGTFHLCVARSKKVIEHHLILRDEDGKFKLVKGTFKTENDKPPPKYSLRSSR